MSVVSILGSFFHFTEYCLFGKSDSEFRYLPTPEIEFECFTYSLPAILLGVSIENWVEMCLWCHIWGHFFNSTVSGDKNNGENVAN